MRKRILGLDIGIASIGWAVVDFDDEKFDPETGEIVEGEIVKSGVRTFTVAENPKTGESLAKPRRDKRLSRRTIRRKARRMQGIKNLFVAKNFITEKELSDLYTKKYNKDVWILRVEALDRKLEKEEFLRVLTHLAKHRGFKSYRKAAEEKDAEGGKVLKAINENKEIYKEKGYRTLAEMIVKENEGTFKRNRSIKNGKKEATYRNSIPREFIIAETKLIFKKQKEFGNSAATDGFLEDFSNIAFRHRDISSVAHMVGNCLFETDEPRAAKESPTAETFVALGKINNFSVFEKGTKRFLTQEERKNLLELLYKAETIKYSTIRKNLFKDKNDIKFCDIEYSPRPKKDPVTKEILSKVDENHNLIIDESGYYIEYSKNKKTGELTEKKKHPEDEKFYSMKGWHVLRKAVEKENGKEKWLEISKDFELLDKVVDIITKEKNDKEIEKSLKEINVENELIKIFKTLTTKEFIKLSFKALYNIVPYMKEGLKYNEACEKAGYDFKSTGEKLADEKGILLPAIPQEKLTTVPAVNRAIAQFRKVYNAIVRKYGTPDQINIEMARDIYNSHEERKKIKSGQESFRNDKERAREHAKECGIDPDRGSNLLKFRLYEQQNGKCIYSGNSIDPKRIDENGYLDIDHIIPYSRSLDNSLNNKVLCLAKENREKTNMTPYEYIHGKKGEEAWNHFVAHINSMKEIRRPKKLRLLKTSFTKEDMEGFRERNINDTRYMAKYIKKYLEDSLSFEESKWDIKNRVQTRNGSLTDYLRHQWGLNKNRSENDRHHALDAIVIACATQGMVKYLSDVSGFIENKYQFAETNNVPKGEAWYKGLNKKFREPWTGFRNDVEQSLGEIFVSRAPRKGIKGEAHAETIKPLGEVKTGIEIRGGIAANGSMVRVDVFEKPNKKGKNEFYLVPIYVADTLKEELPNRYVPFKGETEIDDSFNFKFSLFMDELIYFKKGETEIFGYNKGTDIALGQISVENNDRSEKNKIGVKTQEVFKKYQVDILGNYFEIKREKRLPIYIKKTKK